MSSVLYSCFFCCLFRYDREVGFARADHAEEQSDERFGEMRQRKRSSDLGKIKSHPKRVKQFAIFERFCLEVFPNQEWSKWLLSLEVESAIPPTADDLAHKKLSAADFKPPPLVLIEAFVDHLRREDQNAGGTIGEKKTGGTIRVYVGAIGATCREMKCMSPPTDDPDLQVIISKYEDLDGHKESPTFDMVMYMPLIYTAVFNMRGWSFEYMLMSWTMILVAMCLMARAADITTYCPTIEDIELPVSENLWDVDGLPAWIDLGLRDWKWRSTKNKGKRYSIRCHRNYVDQRFCPVYFILLWLSYTGLTTGPLFQKKKNQKFTGQVLSEDAFTSISRRVFTAVGLYTPGNSEKKTKPSGCTTHAWRRLACQW